MGDNVAAARRLGVLLRGEVLSSFAVRSSTELLVFPGSFVLA